MVKNSPSGLSAQHEKFHGGKEKVFAVTTHPCHTAFSTVLSTQRVS